MQIPIISSSYRSGKMSMRVSACISKASQRHGMETIIVDPQQEKVAFLEKRFMDYEEGTAPENLTRLSKLFSQAPGYILICAEYNYSIPPGLTNILDLFKQEFFRKPFAIVSYSMGPFAGRVSAESLRSLIAGVRGISIPENLPIPLVHDAIGEDGSILNPITESSIPPFFDAFKWYVDALKKAR